MVVCAERTSLCLPLGDGELIADGLVVVPRLQQIPVLPNQLLFKLCDLHAQ